MLDRHVEVADDARLLRDDFEQLRRDAGRVEVHVADPRYGRLAHQGLQHLGQAHAVAAVAPVVGQVLRHEVDLARALHLEQLRLADDVVERERAVLAAHQRDGAERAAVVASFADLEVAHPGRVAGVEPHAGVQRLGVADQPARVQLADELVGLRRAEEEVHLGEGLLHLALVPFHHAPHRHQGLAGAVHLVAGRLDDGVERFLLGRVNEPAGVDDNQLGLVERLDGLAAMGAELGDVAFAVDGVLVAAEGDDGKFHGRRAGVGEPRKLARIQGKCERPGPSTSTTKGEGREGARRGAKGNLWKQRAPRELRVATCRLPQQSFAPLRALRPSRLM